MLLQSHHIMYFQLLTFDVAPLARASHVKWRYTKYLALIFNTKTFT